MCSIGVSENLTIFSECNSLSSSDKDSRSLVEATEKALSAVLV